MDQTEREMLQFWQDRLDEVEQTARDAAHGYPGKWTTADSYAVSVADELPPEADSFERAVAFDEGSPSEEQAAHISLHDPATVLRDVAAARLRLAALAQALEAGHDSYDLASQLLALEVLRYDTDRDYKEAWRP